MRQIPKTRTAGSQIFFRNLPRSMMIWVIFSSRWLAGGVAGAPPCWGF
jgi:hypothetical protein